ncbi:hypothetical protein BJX66DRAFT_302959 [Aspergillus keveii]|uniref:Uncharacterized protein n=1 Tax=Aspergillus keveii TaxID=714993 RepID=A0ABR4G772_9EURO
MLPDWAGVEAGGWDRGRRHLGGCPPLFLCLTGLRTICGHMFLLFCDKWPIPCISGLLAHGTDRRLVLLCSMRCIGRLLAGWRRLFPHSPRSSRYVARMLRRRWAGCQLLRLCRGLHSTRRSRSLCRTLRRRWCMHRRLCGCRYRYRFLRHRGDSH